MEGCLVVVFCFFFKQKTAYELRISDWSSDVCSSDLHCFFTLKDAQSQIRAVLFREELSMANVRPEHGMQVIVHGRLRAYEPQGVYQLYVMTDRKSVV